MANRTIAKGLIVVGAGLLASRVFVPRAPTCLRRCHRFREGLFDVILMVAICVAIFVLVAEIRRRGVELVSTIADVRCPAPGKPSLPRPRLSPLRSKKQAWREAPVQNSSIRVEEKRR